MPVFCASSVTLRSPDAFSFCISLSVLALIFHLLLLSFVLFLRLNSQPYKEGWPHTYFPLFSFKSGHSMRFSSVILGNWVLNGR